ncbi:MAG: ATP-dependent DNA helicase RecQ [Chitinophagales bacterium]
MITAEKNLKSTLKEYFGFSEFKDNQEKIIQSVLAGKDTFVIMPTGGGKSLCYQLPALMSEGTALVVSPLIALMKNQVDLVRGYSQNESVAHFLNSSLTRAQSTKVKQDVVSGVTKLLYVAPETLNKPDNRRFFEKINLSFVAVDEAHCISEWGHDFRPEYRKIKQTIKSLGENVPIIALTATATPKVREDIKKNLDLNNPNIFLSSFNRPNLYYEVRPKGKKGNAERQIIQFLKQKEGKSGIIYVLTRRDTHEVAKLLNVNGIKAAPYNAGLESQVRADTQDAFLKEDIDVIVATIAFGMGIDKPDVRFVIHYSIPKSIENYYQETGRAGRDGLEGHCIAFYSYKDVQKLEKLMKDKPVAEREMNAQLLQEMIAYAETAICRRKFLLHYFGEDFDEENGPGAKLDDNSRYPKKEQESKEDLLKILKVVEESKEAHILKNIVRIVMGRKNQDIEDYQLNELKSFGSGAEQSETYWNSVIRQGILAGYITKSIQNFGVLKLTDAGRSFLKKPVSFKLVINHNFIQEEADQEKAFMESSKSGVLDQDLLKLLKDLRKKEAKKRELPPYVIFQDPSLEEMASQYPISSDEFANITGVSKGKAIKYGKKFSELIKEYVEENDIDRPQDFVMKSVVNKSGIKVFIIQNIDKKIPLEDIASEKGMKLEELLKEIETIVMSGTKLNIQYDIDQYLDEYQQEDIYDYFSESETGSLDEAYLEFEDEGITMNELQMMKIKFLSEVAN